MSNEITNPGFSSKDPAEILVLAFNFEKITSAPLTPVVTIARHAGEADPTPSAVLSGSPQISGAKVLQRVIGGIDGTDYVLTAQIDIADTSRFRLSGVLPVRAT